MNSPRLIFSRRYRFLVPILFAAVVCFGSTVLLAETRFGAMIVKQTLGETPAPELTLPDGWTIL
ncbi:MAG: hypothetical protein J6S27_01635, partial [Thermoguttaceae bacterium]|nr:hypothetical protein [Thermoguttaceae bacterium]